MFEGAIKYKKQINDVLLTYRDYVSYDWMEYVKYWGFPSLIHKQNHQEIVEQLKYMVQKVINIDMLHIKNFTKDNQVNANRILRFLTLQKPGEISQNNLSNYLDTSSANVKSILDTLEKTHLIFHT